MCKIFLKAQSIPVSLVEIAKTLLIAIKAGGNALTWMPYFPRQLSAPFAF
jgi:hypothetical protein